MKKLLLYFLFLFPVISQAQTSVYHPFPDSNAYWCGMESGFNGMCYWNDNYTVYFGNDTLINGDIWHSLRRGGLGDQGCPSLGYYDRHQALIRQDTLQRIVYIHDNIISTDTIFYDFNLQIGDTLNRSKVWFGAFGGGPWLITSIDSVLINGQYRKRYNYSGNGNCADSSIIEGIGCNAGVMSGPSDCFEYFASLRLFSQNHQALYSPNYPLDTAPDPHYQCFDHTLRIDELNEVSFSISPNPAHDKLNVECASFSTAELKIYDMTGREVFATTLRSKHETLNLGLSPALYFVRVGNHVQKLVIE